MNRLEFKMAVANSGEKEANTVSKKWQSVLSILLISVFVSCAIYSSFSVTKIITNEAIKNSILILSFIVCVLYFLDWSAFEKLTVGWIIGVVGVILFATLSFHIIPERLMIFPKEHLSFSNTFITKSDVEKLIDRYNNASLMEKLAIQQEPLVRKLMEKGIIIE